jgi:hypothetical protein
MRYQLPQDIHAELTRRLEQSRHSAGSIYWRSEDDTAIMVQGGPFYGCFLSPDGEAFIEEYHWEQGPPLREWTTVDRSRRAQIQTIVLAAKFDPMIAGLSPQLPQRTQNAVDCESCDGTGWRFSGKLICESCCGLGWYDSAAFRDDD